MQKKIFLTGVTFVLFMVLLRIGVWLSELKPLWNDELYTQTMGIEKLSYEQIVDGKIPEGNNFPLFYVLQKGVCDLTGYRYPQVWQGEWNIGEPTGQFVLRLMPNLMMSFALAAIFYFFSVEFSLWAGIYALLTALSSPMVWMYWAEARPYALWFLLTVLQGLLLLQYLRREDKRESCWFWLCVIQGSLAFSVFLGVLQAVVVLGLLLGLQTFAHLKSKHDPGIGSILVAFIFLIFMGGYYFGHAPHYNFLVPRDWGAIIFDNFPREWLALMVGFALTWLWVRFGRSDCIATGPSLVFVVFTGLLGIMAICLLRYLLWRYDPHHESFEISSRYFMFLAGVGVVAVSYWAVEAFTFFSKSRWMQWNVSIILGGILLLRLIRTFHYVQAAGIY